MLERMDLVIGGRGVDEQRQDPGLRAETLARISLSMRRA
jgi:hypothetical protein